MKTVITVANKILIKDAPHELKELLINELTFDNPDFTDAEKRGYSTYKIPKFIHNFDILPDDSLRIPRGMRQRLLNYIDDLGIDAVINNKLVFNNHRDISNIIGIPELSLVLRPYQRKYLYKLLCSGRTEGIIVSPPGSGKTIFATSLIMALGQSTLWLTHRKLLIKQTAQRFLSNIQNLRPEDIGLIQKGKWNTNPIITIASLDTMRNNVQAIRKVSNHFGMVILDEAHHVPAKTFGKIISELRPHYLYGLTATAYRSDGLTPLMFNFMGDIITKIPLEEVVSDGGILMPTVLYRAIETKTIEGNNIQQIIKYLMNNEKRNNIIVSDVLSEAILGKINIVVSSRKEHCETLYKLISIGWAKTAIITGDYNDKHNDEQLQKLINGEVTTIVATLEKFGEGVDIDILENVFIGLPFRSEQDVEQLIGRVQRTTPTKKEAKIFDYVDHNIGVIRDQFSTPTKNKECRLSAYKRLGLTVRPIEG